MGKENEQSLNTDNSVVNEANYIMFNGKKFYDEDIEYADNQDLGEIPRVENGKLIIANPNWSN